VIQQKSVLAKIYIVILLIIFGGIVLQGPLSVGLGTLWPDYSLFIKSWKEILMLIAGVLAAFLVFKNRRFGIFRDPIIIVIGVYIALHFLILILSFGATGNVTLSNAAGLMIDLRYVVFFVLVYVSLALYPHNRKIFIKVGIAGALVVVVFAMFQVFVLPVDILKYIGYNINTISPYLMVDQNNDFIRINSTLRGPNPLGAYVSVIIALVISAFARSKIKKQNWMLVLAIILLASSIVALWASYSRSALIGAFVAVTIVTAVAIVPRLSSKARLFSAAISALILIICGIFIINNPDFTSNILLHENTKDNNSINSNEGHIGSLVNGFDRMVDQPFGSGIGSIGSASLYGDSPIIIENQYLFIANEVGWFGLALFITIFVMVMVKLWKLREDWLALGVMASGVGLALIGLLLPVWVDDTVSIVWWGLAAIAISNKLLVAAPDDITVL
jgi:hypothetical protein